MDAQEAVAVYWKEHVPEIHYDDFLAEVYQKNPRLREQVGTRLGEYKDQELNELIWKQESILTGLKAALDGQYNWISVFIKDAKQIDASETEPAHATDSQTEPLTYDLIQARSKCNGVITAAEYDFNQLKEKYGLQADFQDFYMYACKYFENERNLDLSRYIDGLRSIERIQELLEMWKGIDADIETEADWVKAFVDKHTQKGTVEAGLQIEPLGPSDVVSETGETTATPFVELDPDYKVHIRFATDRVKVLTKIEGLPDTIITLSEKLYQALTDYAPDYSADAEGGR